MTSRPAARLAFLLAFACGQAAAGGPPPLLDFELSDGRRFVRLSSLPAAPTVVNFWRADCPPCVREMPALANLARKGGARVVTVALQTQAESAAAPSPVLEALSPPVLVLHGPGEPRGLLARFGNRSGGLPHTVVLAADRTPCAQKTGEVDAAWLERALAACPSRHRPGNPSS